ncbi:MAG: hypothetical protein ACE5JX_04210 [Acidobacteriota bacterium]
MLRSFFAVLLGVVLGGLFFKGVVETGHFIYPGLDSSEVVFLQRAVEAAPAGALLVVLLAWGVGSLGGGWLAARLASRARVFHALTVGGLLMVVGILNLARIPYPLWFSILGLLVFLPSSYLGALTSADQVRQPARQEVDLLPKR